MNESEPSAPARITFTYNRKSIAKRYGGPVPRIGERVNIRRKDIQHDNTEGVRQFVVQDVLHVLDDHPSEQEEAGMLINVMLRAAQERVWHVENEE